jgi:hypothetical protein
MRAGDRVVAAVDLGGPLGVRAGTPGVVVQVSRFGGSAIVDFIGPRRLAGLRPFRDLMPRHPTSA